MTHIARTPDVPMTRIGLLPDIITDLQDRLRSASAEIERLAAANVTLRAEVRRLTTAPGLPPVGPKVR
jgi:hypothetical protein